MELPLVSPASCDSRWVREFKNSRTDVHDEPRAGRPSDSYEIIAKVEAAMLEDRRVTVRKLCDLVPDISKTTIDKILREHLGYSKVCAILVPKMLTEDHKRQRVEAAQKFLDCHETDGEELLDSIVTGDETWVHYTTPETKEQSKQWKHTSSPKPLKVRFHHDNARPHTAHKTTAFFEEFGWELVSHPPYSPNLASSDFHFLPELKKNLGGTQFQDDDELEEAVLGLLRGQAAEFFDSGFHKQLNEIIAPDVHPLPLIETILDKLSKAKYYSSVDIASAYWQVEIEPNSRNLLAFVTLDSQYEFCRLPYGFKNSPQIYHRAINQVLMHHKTLQSFLGAVNVYNKFIPDYARLRAPLNKLLKKDVKWNWDPDCQQAFTTLKEGLTSKPVLHLYQVGLPCRLYYDASTQGIAGILKQVHPDGQVHPVQYFSRALRAHERNYTVSELECLAIVESEDKFRIYLTGFVSADIIKQHQPTASPFNIDTNGLHTITRKGVIKIINPETLQHTLMNKVHQEYNHPGISDDPHNYYPVLLERPKGKPYGALGQIPPPQQPFDLISIDTIAGFSKYGHSKTNLHVIVDHLTRYAWTFPSKSTSTLTYIQIFKTVLQQGSPKRLLSDRAPAFTSEKFRKFLITHGIQPLLATSNNPQANGLIERLNATITGKLRLAYLENPKASWTQLVKRVTQTYNNTPHSVTSFPPTYLMFNVIPPDLRTHLNPYPEINKARDIASSRTQNKHRKDKETFDKQHRTPHFEVNDIVLVKNYGHPDTGHLRSPALQYKLRSEVFFAGIRYLNMP
ncbi:hypothetical protein LAZ67_6002319 [Cordylochernes scorpioides]|uniref:Integrase catalytic domain-containing protein n=1 Tax=Cordylochernes scorpioides TaxID=51811 RepID=A0ABY6KKS1_9ARAC|nr:hypothetical protein LAZ67_6002319 [Cordylochernes scorpioides]